MKCHDFVSMPSQSAISIEHPGKPSVPPPCGFLETVIACQEAQRRSFTLVRVVGVTEISRRSEFLGRSRVGYAQLVEVIVSGRSETMSQQIFFE